MADAIDEVIRPTFPARLSDFRTGVIDRQRIALLARAMRDTNPVHQDSEFARTRGLQDCVAQGSMVMALLAHPVVHAFGVRAVRSVEAQLRQPLYAGRRVLVTATLEHEGEGLGQYTLRCESDQDEEIATGSAIVDGAALVRHGD